jgi:hypothetical protein
MSIDWNAPTTAYTAEQLYAAFKDRLTRELVAVVHEARQSTDVGDIVVPAQRLRLEPAE